MLFMKSQYWADQIAEKMIKEHGGKTFTVAAGISPSGIIHLGNFREIITTDLVCRALKDKGAEVRFIYSWDDYDRFRKVPNNIPKKDMLKESIGLPVSEVPNVFGSKYKSYAEHIENILKESIKKVGITPVFIRQYIKYKNCDYAEGIRTGLLNKKRIAEILNKYRKEPLSKDWWPAVVYCEKCRKDFTKIEEYDRAYSIMYSCKCGYKNTFDFRKKGLIKLKWKADWPMRWAYEQVDFEPGGKDHSTYGSSYTVGKEIVKIFGWSAPEYIMYDFINMKGHTGKMSSSEGNTQSVDELLKFYLPELIRYTFAGRTPKTEIFYPMDDGIFKHYEDFYYTERIYFGKEKVSKKEEIQRKRIYRMSVIDKPAESMPIQPAFKHCVEVMNMFNGDILLALNYIKKVERVKQKTNIERYKLLLNRAWNWIQEFADEKYKFVLNEKSKKLNLTKPQRNAVEDLSIILAGKPKGNKLTEEIRTILSKYNLSAKEFYQIIYQILINKNTGPRLVPFIEAVGYDNVKKLLKSAI